MSKSSYVTLEELLAKRPGDTARIAQARDEILTESRAHRLAGGLRASSRRNPGTCHAYR